MRNDTRGGCTRMIGHQEEPDLFCGEIASTLASQHSHCPADAKSRLPQHQELEYDVFLRALLRKMDEYRPEPENLNAMKEEGFLRMRAAVVEWFSGVALSYGFSRETVMVALSNFDRYVAKALRPVDSSLLLQLVAYVSLLIASKMEEVKPLHMSCLAQLTGQIFTPQQVRTMEISMLHKLQFRLAPPSANEMLHCLIILLHPGWPSDTPLDKVLSLGSHFLTKAQSHVCWFSHSPFTLAVAAFICAFEMLGLGWLKGAVLRECDSRAREVRCPGAAVDVEGVSACAAVMMGLEEAADVTSSVKSTVHQAASALEGGVGRGCGDDDKAEGWGSPTGVIDGAARMDVGVLPVGNMNGNSGVGESVGTSQCSRGVGGSSPARAMPGPQPRTVVDSRPSGCCQVTLSGNGIGVCAEGGNGEVLVPGSLSGQKRALIRTTGSCFSPHKRRTCVQGRGESVGEGVEARKGGDCRNPGL
ncbi:unnamed protein product [Choristocarpus tenellus]